MIQGGKRATRSDPLLLVCLCLGQPTAILLINTSPLYQMTDHVLLLFVKNACHEWHLVYLCGGVVACTKETQFRIKSGSSHCERGLE